MLIEGRITTAKSLDMLSDPQDAKIIADSQDVPDKALQQGKTAAAEQAARDLADFVATRAELARTVVASQDADRQAVAVLQNLRER